MPDAIDDAVYSTGLTLDEIANMACSKTGQLDATSFARCKDYINRRYQLVWDAADWKDLEGGGFAATEIDPENRITVPDAVGLIKSVFYKAKWLEYVRSSDLYQLTLPDFGEPLYYRETLLGTGPVIIRKIILAPVPVGLVAADVVIVPKLEFIPLTETDRPAIRNISNILLAYAEGDMWERMRQVGKAKENFAEAETLLQRRIAVETEQANRARAIKSITVSGDSLSELTDAVCSRCAQWTTPYVIMIKDMLRRNYVDLYDSQLWPETTIIAEVNRDGSEIILPEYFDRVQSVRQNVNLAELVPIEGSLLFGINPQLFEQSGSPVAFQILTSVAVPVLPPINEELEFVLSNGEDNFQIFVRGETQGVEVSESPLLTGTAPIRSAFSYDTPITIAKPITRGAVTITGAISRTFLGILYAGNRELRYMRLWLQPTPQDKDGAKALILGKRKCNPLLTDDDTPILRGIGNILINQTASEIFTQLGNDKMAQQHSAKAATALQGFVDREIKQNAFAQRILPYVEPSYDGYGQWGYGTFYTKANP